MTLSSTAQPCQRTLPERPGVGTAPERQCVGCRERALSPSLLRFVLGGQPPVLVPDVRRRLPGRGAWVHPRRRCIEQAVRRGGFQRSFQTKVTVDPAELAASAARQYTRRLEGLLLAASRRRALAIGTDATRETIQARGASLLLVAVDAAGRREEITSLATRLESKCVVFGTKAELGRLFGRNEIGIAAILEAPIAEQVAHAATCATELSEDA